MAENFMLEEGGQFLEVICLPRYADIPMSDYFVLEVSEETPYGVSGTILKQGQIPRLGEKPSQHSTECYCEHHTKRGSEKNVIIPWSRIHLAYGIYEYDCLRGGD